MEEEVYVESIDTAPSKKTQQKINQEQIHGLLFSDKLSWQAIMYDLINTEQLDPWDIDISLLSCKFLERVRKLEEADFFISSKVLFAAALLLRIKSEILLREDIRSLDDILFGKKEEINNPNASLQRFIAEDTVVAILADHREKNNRVVKELIDLGISVKTAQLTSADYVISGTVGVELKKVPDFVASIIDGRLLEQARELKQNFSKALIIIEGEEDIFSVRHIHPNAVRGMIASLALDFHLPLLYTKNPKDTAALLAVMAKREQDKGRDFSFHDRKPKTLQEQLQFIVSSLPTIGPVNAQKLLERFKSLKNLANASAEELILVDGIGEKTAERICQLFEEEYTGKK